MFHAGADAAREQGVYSEPLKCGELAGTPGMKLSMSDQALFTHKLLFRFSYLGKWDFFFPVEYFSATIYIHCSRIWNIDLLILGAF